MDKISVRLSPDELQALVTLASNQLFRMKFIDPKMPGHTELPGQMEHAKSAVAVIEAALAQTKSFSGSSNFERPARRRTTT